MGGQKITGAFGEEYREYIVTHLANGKRGSADICAYFFIRGTQMLRQHGQLGSLATNTIAQGDTREVGLDQLLEGSCVIPRAIRSHPWPGAASLEIALVWVRKGKWASLFVLDEKPATGITAFLTPPGSVVGNPHRLVANEGKSFKGVDITGEGFILSPDEAQELLRRDPRNSDVIFPFLNGIDLNSRCDQSSSRYVINFFDWPLDRQSAPTGYTGPVARDYPLCLSIVESQVKPQRMKNNRKIYRDYWWQYAEKRQALKQVLPLFQLILVRGEVANLHSMAFVPTTSILSNKLCIFPFEQFSAFALLQSTIHEAWARQYAPTMRTDMSYSNSDCFETFPFPINLNPLEDIGNRYYADRRQLMLARNEGLTKTYNRFHKSNEASTDIQKLRQLHVEMDKAVAAAYGWADLELDHGFHETKQGIRYTITEAARREVLARLLKLNHERYAEEVKQGLHDSKAKKSAGGGKRKPRRSIEPAAATASLFDSVVDTAFPNTDRDRFLCGLLCDLVVAQQGLESTAYLDAMVIALRYKRHGGLLIGNEQKQFSKLSGVLPDACVQSADKIPWRVMLDLLERQDALVNDGKHLERGNRFDEMRSAYPACDPKLIELIHKAAATLRELQSAAKPDTEQELPTFKEDYQALYGGSS